MFIPSKSHEETMEMDTCSRVGQSTFELWSLPFNGQRTDFHAYELRSFRPKLVPRYNPIAAPASNSILHTLNQLATLPLPESYRPGNAPTSFARPKPLIVRVVRKASLALIFLTTLPLHPKNMLVKIHIFWFLTGGRTRKGFSNLMKSVRKWSGVYVE